MKKNVFRRGFGVHQRGLTLIELMIGLTLGLIVITALLTLLANASVNGQNLNRTSVQVENGRYAAELLQDELRMAGFVGELPLAGVAFTPGATSPYTTPDPCSTAPSTAFSYDAAAAVPLKVPAPVQGYASTEVLSCLSNRLAGTDAIVIRQVANTTTDVSALTGANRQWYVQYSFCETDPAVKLVFDKNKTALTLKNRACTAQNVGRAYVTRIYYVASCNVCGSDTTPTLKRVELVGDTLVETPLVEGVETLRFEYGFDTDSNGSADIYQATIGDPTSSATGSWGNVMTVKAYFITRSLDRVVGSGLSTAQQFQFGSLGAINTTADGYVRRGYTSVVQLINPSATRGTS